jgi:phage terminase large subunit
MSSWGDKVAEWKRAPRTFVREAFGAIPETWQEQDVLIPLENGERFFAVRAGHGVGKTTLEAWLILWFLLFHRPCKIPVTANSQDQLRDVVWAEIAKWWRKLPPFLQEMIEIEAERVYIKADPAGAFAVARTARQERPEALQGFHSEHLFFVIEEASGIHEIIFQTAGGALTGKNAMVLMCGNPTRITGYFHAAFHKNRNHWHCVHVPCSKSSRVDPGYAKKIAAEYGSDSNVYRVRVEGEFPTAEAASVIPLEWAEAAKNRNLTISAVWPKWGCDPARFGDDRTALVRRQGNTITHSPNVWKNLDGPQVAGRIIELYNSTPKDQRPRLICVDVIGIGASVVDHLRLPDSPVKDIIRAVNVAESASNSDKYHRLRDELWWKGREWFAGKDCCIKIDPHWSSDQKALVEELLSELTAPTYDFSVSGKIVVQSKEDMKKDGLRSPDIADAFLLTFAGGEVSRARLDVHRDYEPDVIDPWAL